MEDTVIGYVVTHHPVVAIATLAAPVSMLLGAMLLAARGFWMSFKHWSKRDG